MNKKKITEEEVLEIGSKAKRASFKVSLLSEKEKNSVLYDAADNLRKAKRVYSRWVVDGYHLYQPDSVCLACFALVSCIPS